MDEELIKALEDFGWRFVEKKSELIPLYPSLTYEPDEIELEILEALGVIPRRYDPTLSQWMTPEKLALSVARWANVQGRTVLDPCAGDGSLVAAALKAGAAQVVAYELDDRLVDVLCERFAGEGRVRVFKCDFFEVESVPYDNLVALMNPPYENNQEATFVGKCFEVGCELVTSITRVNALHGKNRWKVFRNYPIIRGIRCINRPSFNGESTGGRFDTLVTMRALESDGSEQWSDWEESW